MLDWRQLLNQRDIRGVAVWPLRLFLGVTFIWASLDKLVDPAFFDATAPGYVGHQLASGADSSPLGGLLTGVIVPHATLFGMLTMAGELLIGLAVLLGWYTRFSAVMGLLINLMFFLTITWDVRPYYYGADLVFVVAWLTLALTGPGPLSIDAYLRRRLETQAPAVARAAGAAVTTRPVAAAGPPARGATGPRSGGRPAATPTRVAPAGRPAPGQAAGRATLRANVVAAELSRRQFNTLAASAAAAAVLGALDMAAGSLLHGGSPRRAATQGSGATGTTGPPGPTPAANPAGLPAAPPTPAAQAPGANTATAAPAAPAHGAKIADAGQVPVGQSLQFTDPSDGYPGVLVHLDSGYTAYAAICTHEDCEVSYLNSAHLIGCPCHGSLFDPAANGQVVRGPARRPLQPIAITVAGDGAVYLAS